MITISYTTKEKIRTLSGLDSEDVSDSKLDTILDYVDKIIKNEIAIKVTEQVLDPDLDGSWINGTNKVFYTPHSPLADIDYDKEVGTSEVRVYTWSDEFDASTKKEVAVDSVSGTSGRIVLKSSPASTIENITSSYSYYNMNHEPDWTLIELATTYYSAFLAMQARGPLPKKYSIGRFRVTDDLPGSNQYLRQAQRFLHMAQGSKASRTDKAFT